MKVTDSRKKIVWNRLSRLGLAAQAGILCAIVSVVALPLALAAYAISGLPGVVAALVAACVCLLGGEIALGLCGLLARRHDALYAVLAGMLARTSVPLLLGLGLHVLMPSLTQAGLFFYFLAFYLVILTSETILAVAHASRDATSGKAV